MSYLQFLLIFILTPIVLLAIMFRSRRDNIPFSSKRILFSIAAIAGIAFVYTIPWDNYLVANNIWWYPENRVVARIGYVPLEEYCFFILQPLLESLLILVVISFRHKNKPHRTNSLRTVYILTLGFFVILFAFGVYAWFEKGHFTYMALILVWACPVIIALIMWKPEVLSFNGRSLWMSLTIGTLYLCAVDLYAIEEGIWAIGTETSLPLLLWGLPIEEAMFYFLTSFLSCFGFLLFLNVWNLYKPFPEGNTL